MMFNPNVQGIKPLKMLLKLTKISRNRVPFDQPEVYT